MSYKRVNDEDDGKSVLFLQQIIASFGTNVYDYGYQNIKISKNTET